jgi:hypothetical protein
VKTRRISIGYDSLPSQSRFHDSKARFKGFSGPVGSGKSMALCQEALKLAMENAGRTGLIGAPTYAMLRDATLPALMEVLEESGIAYEHNKGESWLKIEGAGSKILLRSLDEYERLRGSNLAWFGVDELTYVEEPAWLRLEARLRDPKAKRLCGFGVWTPKGYDWVWRRFVQSPVDGYETVLAKPHENRHLLKAVPDYYERLKASYDADFYEQEVMGSYLSPGEGLVYRSFSRERNVAKTEYDESLALTWALDFNVEPMSSVVAQVDGEEVRVLDEIVLRRAGTLDACEEFARRYPEFPAGLRIYADASGNQMHTTGGSDKEVIEGFFQERGMRGVRLEIPKSNPPVRQRIELVNGRLRAASGDVALKVDPRCKELIADFEQVQYVAGTCEVDKGKDPKRTHLSDALGYLLWQECRGHAQRIGERGRRLF